MSEKISIQLKRRRVACGLSLRQVGKLAGVSPQTILSAEEGRLGQAGKLARHLAVLGLELRAVRVRQ